MNEQNIQSADRRKLEESINEAEEVTEDLNRLIEQMYRVGAPPGQPFVFTGSVKTTEQLLRRQFAKCDDIKYRRILSGGREILLVFVTGMTDADLVQSSIIEPLLKLAAEKFPPDVKTLSETVLTAISLVAITEANEALQGVLTGKTLVAIDGLPEVLLVETAKFVKRNIEPSENETVIRGPRDAFNETLMDNLVLLRRRAKETDLKVNIFKLGERTQTAVAVVYIDGLVKIGLVDEIQKRLSQIKIDKILLSATVEELIETHPWTPFPKIQATERPETVAAALYDGRAAIMVDNSPYVLIVPTMLAALLQSTEDYTTPATVVSLIRITRFFSAFVAIFLPSLYVSVVSYHPGMLPTTLAVQIAELRARTPFPSFLEALLMEVLLEVFQEAITRLPRKIAGAAGVVGALVIGTTVVQAGLVNPLLVVVVAITAIASYSMPSYNFAMALRFFRVPVLIAGTFFGLFGVMLAFIALVVHMCSLRTFGESYAGGLFDITLLADWKDTFVRLPRRYLRGRPKEFGAQERGAGGIHDQT